MSWFCSIRIASASESVVLGFLRGNIRISPIKVQAGDDFVRERNWRALFRGEGVEVYGNPYFFSLLSFLTLNVQKACTFNLFISNAMVGNYPPFVCTNMTLSCISCIHIDICFAKMCLTASFYTHALSKRAKVNLEYGMHLQLAIPSS